jgi:hypothetical protein
MKKLESKAWFVCEDNEPSLAFKNFVFETNPLKT